MINHRGCRLWRSRWWRCSGAIVLILLGTACPSDRAAVDDDRRVEPSPPPTPGTGAPSAADAAPEERDATNHFEAGARTTAPEHYEKQLPLEGTVRFVLAGKCTGCEGGTLRAKAKVKGRTIAITGEGDDCSGPCTAYRRVKGSVTVKRLRRATYNVTSDVEVTAIEPLSLSSAKRTDWVLFMLHDDCDGGIKTLTGEEHATKALVEAVGGCLSKVAPEVRFEAISSMLTWENKKAYVPVLIQSLDDTKVAYLAARVLGRTEDRRAVGPLIKALASDDESLRWDAARSLKIITGEDFGDDPERWQRWHEN